VLFIIGIGVLIGYGWTTNARTIRDEAVRAAETRAAADAAVARCMTSRPQLQRVSRHVLGVNEFAAVLVENSARTLEATPRSDPQYAVRKTNLHRSDPGPQEDQGGQRLPRPKRRGVPVAR
jgi:hypothetical protein